MLLCQNGSQCSGEQALFWCLIKDHAKPSLHRLNTQIWNCPMSPTQTPTMRHIVLPVRLRHSCFPRLQRMSLLWFPVLWLIGRGLVVQVARELTLLRFLCFLWRCQWRTHLWSRSLLLLYVANVLAVVVVDLTVKDTGAFLECNH